MENETTDPEKETVKTPPALNLEEIQAQLTQMTETNKRLLSESKKNADKYRSLRDETSSDETKALEEKKDWQALLKKSRQETSDLTEKFDQLKVKNLKSSLNLQVSRFAKDAHNVDDIINALDTSLVQMDQETETFAGVEDAVKDLRSKKAYLFTANTPGATVNTVPGMIPPKEKTLGNMSMQEKLDLLTKTMTAAQE